MPKKPDAVSLYFETLQIVEALEGARSLLYGLNEADGGLRGSQARQLLDSGVSMLGLLVARLRLLGRVLYGDADPVTLMTPQNRLPASVWPDLDADALLHLWSDAEQTEQAGTQAQRTRSRRSQRQR